MGKESHPVKIIDAALSRNGIDRKQEKEQLKTIDEMLVRPENRNCADCRISSPRWASVNIGCFLCIRCAGAHRKLGSHISKVKSTNLDQWSPEMLNFVGSMGNDKVNKTYLSRGNAPDVDSNSSDVELEEYIRAKYEQQAYSKHPQRQNINTNNASSSSSSTSYSRQLENLVAMGFTNHQANIAALEKSNGSVERAVEIIVANAGPASPVHQKQQQQQQQPHQHRQQQQQQPHQHRQQQQLQQQHQSSQEAEPSYQTKLKNMGFTDMETNEKAYTAANGNMEQTVSYIVEWQISRPTQQPTHQKQQQQPVQQQQQQATPVVNDLLDVFGEPAQQRQFQQNQQFSNYGQPQQQQQQQMHFHQQQQQAFVAQNQQFVQPLAPVQQFQQQFNPQQQQHAQIQQQNQMFATNSNPFLAQAAPPQQQQPQQQLQQQPQQQQQLLFLQAQNANPFQQQQANQTFQQQQNPFARQQVQQTQPQSNQIIAPGAMQLAFLQEAPASSPLEAQKQQINPFSQEQQQKEAEQQREAAKKESILNMFPPNFQPSFGGFQPQAQQQQQMNQGFGYQQPQQQQQQQQASYPLYSNGAAGSNNAYLPRTQQELPLAYGGQAASASGSLAAQRAQTPSDSMQGDIFKSKGNALNNPFIRVQDKNSNMLGDLDLFKK